MLDFLYKLFAILKSQSVYSNWVRSASGSYVLTHYSNCEHDRRAKHQVFQYTIHGQTLELSSSFPSKILTHPLHQYHELHSPPSGSVTTKDHYRYIVCTLWPPTPGRSYLCAILHNSIHQVQKSINQNEVWQAK